MHELLEIDGLHVSANRRKILSNISLSIGTGKSYIMFGPNGSGKTSLLMAIMGMPEYTVSSGRVLFEGKDITKKTVDERAMLGIGLGFQLPQEIRGIKLIDLLKTCAGKTPEEELDLRENKLIKRFMLDDMLYRDANVSFSGGEKKRAEILQILFMKPKLMLLDEPDSGVDLESLRIIGKEIRNYLEEKNASALLITHQGHIMEHIQPENGCVLLKNTIYCFEDPASILEDIREKGYEGCLKCRRQKKE